MTITDQAIELITTRAINRIALEFDCSVYTVKRWIDANEPNGDLTKTKAVQIISEETGLTDSEILMEAMVPDSSTKVNG